MSDDVQVPCGRSLGFFGDERDYCRAQNLCGNCTELLALRARVAELEATAATAQTNDPDGEAADAVSPVIVKWLLKGPAVNMVNVIARQCGWLPLKPGEKMTVHYNKDEYVIARAAAAEVAAGKDVRR